MLLVVVSFALKFSWHDGYWVPKDTEMELPSVLQERVVLHFEYFNLHDGKGALSFGLSHYVAAQHLKLNNLKEPSYLHNWQSKINYDFLLGAQPIVWVERWTMATQPTVLECAKPMSLVGVYM